MLVAQDILGIDVRLTFILLDDVILGRRIDLAAVFEGPRSIPQDRLGDDDPQVPGTDRPYNSRLMEFLRGNSNVLERLVVQMYARGL